MGSNKEKSNIAIAILEKLRFLKSKKTISHFDGSTNIFRRLYLTKPGPEEFAGGEL